MTMMLYPPDSPSGRILGHLQRQGEASIRELEELLGISTTAVREHLAHLEARHLIGAKLVRQGPGRPKLVYSLQPRANELFPTEYGTLVTLLMRELSSRENPAMLQSLLDAVGARLATEYGVHLTGESLDQRLGKTRVGGLAIQLG